MVQPFYPIINFKKHPCTSPECAVMLRLGLLVGLGPGSVKVPVMDAGLGSQTFVSMAENSSG